MDEQERSRQLDLACAGDADALQRLIVEYHNPLRRALEGKMDPAMRRRLDPDDVLQETYAAAFESIGAGRFDGPGAFYKWLERIALNKLKDQQRAMQRQKRDAARELHRPADARTSYPDLVERVIASESTPSRRLARNEAIAAVLSSLARLTEEQRDVVRLRFLEGRSVAEVATHLDKTEPAVHMLCHRGLKALREHLGSISRYLSHP